MFKLHDYQESMVERCAEAFKIGRMSVCAVLPTGAGKTACAVEMCRRHLRLYGAGASIIWLAPMRELVSQAKGAFPPDVHTVTSTKEMEAQHTLFPRVHISTVHALAQTGYRPRATMMVLDEAQYFFGTPAWNNVALEYIAKGVRILSLTATPARVDGEPLSKLADELVVGPSIKTLVERWRRTEGREGLVPPHVYAPSQRLQAPCMDPVEAYQKHAPDTKAVIFCSTVEQAIDTAIRFCEAGIPAAAASAQDRDAIADHKAGNLRVLCNVFLVSVGYDDPTIETVILARGISNPSTWIQIVGRPLRRSPGKARAIVLDLLGNVHQHGLPEEERTYSLEGKAIRLAAGSDPLTTCDVCGTLYRPGGTACACGPAIREMLPKVEKAPTAAQIKRMELQRIHATEPELTKKNFYERMRIVSKVRGWKPGSVDERFRAKYGYYPPKEWRA